METAMNHLLKTKRMGESLRYVNSFCLILWPRIALQKKGLGKFQRQRDNLNPSKVHGRASENSCAFKSLFKSSYNCVKEIEFGRHP